MRVIIAAAGTGGHINPGIAIANKIKEKEKDSKIIFVGTTRGIENDLVPRAGYELKTVEAYGFSKKISLQSIKNNLKTIQGFSQAKKIVKDFKPDIVIGTGGYICGGAILAAHRLKIPTAIHESNAYPGVATKFLESRLNRIFVGFKDTIKYFKDQSKVIWTGTPTKVKENNLNIMEKNKVIEELGLKANKPIILVFGGSQGAKKINDTMIELIRNRNSYDYQIYWATGPKQYGGIKEEFEKYGTDINNIKGVKIVPYIYDMSKVMNVVDIVICRSGAMTITELSLLGKPAIFVPLPSSSANRQVDNANILAKLGAAKIILNDKLNKDCLEENIIDMIKDKQELKAMGERAKTIAKYNVEDHIYEEIKRLTK